MRRGIFGGPREQRGELISVNLMLIKTSAPRVNSPLQSPSRSPPPPRLLAANRQAFHCLRQRRSADGCFQIAQSNNLFGFRLDVNSDGCYIYSYRFEHRSETHEEMIIGIFLFTCKLDIFQKCLQHVTFD